MTKRGSILVVDDNKGILQALDLLLQRYFKDVITISSPNLIDSCLREHSIDVVLLDMNFTAKINTGNEGLYWLKFIKNKLPDTQVVVFTAYADIDLAVEAVKMGASDFVVKPWDNEKLIASLTNAYNVRKSKEEVKHLKEIKNELSSRQEMFWGESAAMLDLKRTIEKVAKTDANILITGENGTGKEMLSCEIHSLSRRNKELMITVDMGAIVETLFESELFGHVKGAFTDARADRAGKFEIAHNGTLFLDEIGNLPLHMQAKLLTAIQSGKIIRVGSNNPIAIDIRLICATNKDLSNMVTEGSFREDLLYRINTIHVHIPPLRDRGDDVLHFASLFLKKYGTKYNKPVFGFSASALDAIKLYKWPGNVRELEHTIEKAVILSESDLLEAEDLMLKPFVGKNTEKENCSGEFETLQQMEKAMIKAAFVKYNGNLSAIAQQLGITRQTLYNKMAKYEI